MAVNRAIQPTKGVGEPLENYALTTIPKPKASPKNVVVRVVLRPVNPTDLLTSRWGTWAHLDLKDVVVGSEGVGVVDEVGEGVTKVAVGQRVVPLVWNRISDKVAAQFIINPWTAYGLLKRLQISKGEYLVQTAAGSVLGRLIIALAKHYGIKTINVVRRDEWIQPLKDIGADYVINSSKEDVKAKVQEVTGGKGAYGAVDPVATESTRVLASSVRAGGVVLVYGALSGAEVRMDIGDLLRQVSVGFFLVNDFSHDLPQREQTVNAILELLSNKIIDPLIGKTYPLEEFKEAMEETEGDGRGGKVLLSSY